MHTRMDLVNCGSRATSISVRSEAYDVTLATTATGRVSYCSVAYGIPPRTKYEDGLLDGVNRTAPASTYILVVGIVATFCAFGTVVIFLPPWEWYLIPVACALPVVTILALRWLKHRRMRSEMQATLAQLG